VPPLVQDGRRAGIAGILLEIAPACPADVV